MDEDILNNDMQRTTEHYAYQKSEWLNEFEAKI